MGGRRRSRKSERLSKKRETHKSEGAARPEPGGYSIELTETAERTYRNLWQEARRCRERGDGSGAKVTLFEMVDEAVNRIIPADPLNRSRALSSSPLSNIFRVKKGRLRICYVVSSLQRRIVILYISETPRKEGDVYDPYAVFSQLVESGEFDKVFAELGIRFRSSSVSRGSTLIQ